MLTKETVLNKVEILAETGHVLVRYATRVLENGVPVTSDSYHRTSFEPGAELPKDVDAIVSGAAALAWTPAILQAQAARVAADRVEGGTTISPVLAPKL